MRVPDHLAVLQNGGGIPKRPAGAFGIFFNVPDGQRDGTDAFGSFGEGGQVRGDKIGSQQHIARRITA